MRSSSWKVIFVHSLLILLGVGNGHSLLRAQTTEKNNPPPAEIGTAQIEEFATAMKKAVIDSNSTAFNRLFDWEALIQEMTKLPPSAPKLKQLDEARSGFETGFLKAAQGPTGLIEQFVAVAKAGGRFDLLRAGHEGQRPFALIRIIPSEEGGLNYFKIYLARSQNGQVLAVDFYSYMSGELFTESGHLPWKNLVAQIQAKFGGPQNQDARTYMMSVPKMSRMSDALQQKKYEEVLKLYASLPKPLQRNKSVLLLRMRAAHQFSEKEYAKAMADVTTYYPQNPANDFLMIDVHFTNHQFEDALRCIKSVESHLGGDPFLKIMQAEALISLRRPVQAIAAVKQARQDEPNLEQIYTLGLSSVVAAKDYDLAVEFLNELKNRFQVELDIDKDPDFSEFGKSPQYEKWSKNRN